MAPISENDLQNIIANLENQELEQGYPSAELYTQLLAAYLLRGDLTYSKFLWKRIPESVKNANPDLCHVWEVGKKMWKREYPGIYESLSKEWPQHLKIYMDALKESSREKCFELMSMAYSCISGNDVSAKLGLTTDETIKVCLSKGWTYDEGLQVFYPRKPETVHEESTTDVLSDQHLIELIEYVNFLEN